MPSAKVFAMQSEQARRGKRSRGRPNRRWQDDITRKDGTTWNRKATDRRQWKTLMEGYILSRVQVFAMQDEQAAGLLANRTNTTDYIAPYVTHMD